MKKEAEFSGKVEININFWLDYMGTTLIDCVHTASFVLDCQYREFDKKCSDSAFCDKNSTEPLRTNCVFAEGSTQFESRLRIARCTTEITFTVFPVRKRYDK